MINYTVSVYDNFQGCFVSTDLDEHEDMYAAIFNAKSYTEGGRKGFAIVSAVTKWNENNEPVEERPIYWTGRRLKKFAHYYENLTKC